jgi:hypothetical protein
MGIDGADERDQEQGNGKRGKEEEVEREGCTYTWFSAVGRGSFRRRGQGSLRSLNPSLSFPIHLISTNREPSCCTHCHTAIRAALCTVRCPRRFYLPRRCPGHLVWRPPWPRRRESRLRAARCAPRTGVRNAHHVFAGVLTATAEWALQSFRETRGMRDARITHATRTTRACIFPDVKWVAQMESTAFPPRLDLFEAVAAHLAQQRAEDEGDPKLATLGCTWLRGFLDRHPGIAARYAVRLDIPRALAGQPGPIRRYFELLGRLFAKYHFKRQNIYNMDKKGFMLGVGNRAKVGTHRTTKPPKETQHGSREWITVVETCAADNTMLPPMVIYQGQAIYRGWYDVDVKMDPRTAFARSDKGITTDELARDWLRDYFDPWTKTRANGEPRLLLLDGHRSHYSLAFVRYARYNNILLVSYPGHSTHLLQPLDLVLFSPLQKAYSTAVADYTRTSRCSITKKDFWKFYLLATAENIKSAWRKSGVFPFNPDDVLQPLLQKQKRSLIPP